MSVVALLKISDVFKKCLVLSLAMAVISFLLSLFLIDEWQAKAIYRGGYIAGVQVNSASSTAALINHDSFKEYFFSQSCSKNDYKTCRDFKSIKAKVIRETDFVEIQLNASSKKKARERILKLIELLKQKESALFLTVVQDKRNEVLELSQSLQSLRSNTILKLKSGNLSKILSEDLYKIEREREFQELLNRKLMLSEQLTPLSTFEAKVVGDIYISESPVWPQRFLIFSGIFVLTFLIRLSYEFLGLRR